MPRNKTFFNISRNKAADKIFLVESSFDAIRIEQEGGKAIASLGSSVSKRQRDLLKRYFNSIILISDNDEAGRSMRDKLVQSLGSMVITAELPETVKDVSDLNNEELHTYILQFENEINYILNNI
jgi:DNA primase